jgi:hypothetical protein
MQDRHTRTRILYPRTVVVAHAPVVCVRRPASDARRFRHGVVTSPAARQQDFGDCSTIPSVPLKGHSVAQQWHTMQRNEHTADDGGAVAAAWHWPR